jgi:hypothetical protein
MDWNRFSMIKAGNKHKRFEYVPRYYDPRKEALEKKIKQAKAEAGQHVDENKLKREINFRTNIDERWGSAHVKNERVRSNLRLMIILFIIIGLFYFFFQGLDSAGQFIDKNL